MGCFKRFGHGGPVVDEEGLPEDPDREVFVHVVADHVKCCGLDVDVELDPA